MKHLQTGKWFALLVAFFMLFASQVRAQEVDDLQEYLDQLATEQKAQMASRPGMRKIESVTVPVGLTEVNLSNFTSYQNRTKQVSVKANVKFTNGTISAASTYSGGTSLLKVYDGATVVLDESAGVNAGSATTANCIAAVGIYGGSTFYQCGDITAPASCTGKSVYLDTSADTYYYVSGSTCGDIDNPGGGTVVGVDHEYVDLGLPSGTLWATCNVGADSPEEYGDYFAWGETVPYGGEDQTNARNYAYAGTYTKTYYGWSTYKYCNGSSSTLTKYCYMSNFGYNGFTDNLTELTTDDDAATANWGSEWRMPTDAQLTELRTNCTWTWTQLNGVNGYRVTGSNSNSIFLPAAGDRNNSSLYNAGSDGYYWSRSLYTSTPNYAYFVYFNSSYVSWGSSGRCLGLSVRPVRLPSPLVEGISLTPATLALTVGASSQLTATVSPSNAAQPALTWSSSDTEVAVVGSDGWVEAVAAGTCTIFCSATDGSAVTATCQVTVTSPLFLGDVNGDGSIDTSDITALGDILVGKDYSAYSLEAADLNQDGYITYSDLMSLVYLVYAGTNPSYPEEVGNSSNTLYMNTTEVTAGAELDLSIRLRNTLNIEAFQFTLSLPSGISLVTDGEGNPVVTLSDARTISEGALCTKIQSDGSLTVCYAPFSVTPISGTDGEVIKVRVRANGSLATGNYTARLKDIWVGSDATTSKVYNISSVNATITCIEPYTYALLKSKLDDIGTELDKMYAKYNQANTMYQSVSNYLTEAQQTQVETRLVQVKAALDVLAARKTALGTQLESAATSTYSSLNTQIETLASDVADFKSNLNTELDSQTESIKAALAQDLQARLATQGNEIAAMQQSYSALSGRRAAISTQIGDGYFLYTPTAAYNTQLANLDSDLSATATSLQTLITHYNALINNSVINTAEDAVAIYQGYEAIETEKATVSTNLENCATSVGNAENDMLALEYSFPDESLAYTVKPTGLSNEIQLGYKSNRGFVLTSAGMMWFEQKEGADFYLKDAEDNYIVATSGLQALTTGTKAKATVWTGQNLHNGSYTFQGKAVGAYLGYSGVTVNSAIIADSGNAYAWTITESDLDDLQAFLNLLAEEEEVENSGESTMTETDTLVVHVPVVTCDCNHDPFVFPIVPYPIRWYGWPDHRTIPIPRPATGIPDENFHPIHIPKGSHVVLDDVDFSEIIGGHHVIYVDGVLEVKVNVTIYIEHWEWFIKVGPHGRVIWRPQPGTEGRPRIKNEGILDMEDGGMAYLDNTGTVNHKKGTITKVVNRKTYHFTGGIVGNCWNYGDYSHQGGSVLTARNFEDGTYTMTGGSIENTVVTVTDTIFVNCGKFYFRGGWMRGYGSRMLYNKKGGYLWIDGGQFDFTHIHDYFIEAHDDFYIRGDHNYNSPVPMLINPSVTIRILYNWIYKFKIVFINGCPTPRYPLFYGYDFDLGSDFFQFIDWQLPNKRWRWYYKAEDNTIEPRDEEVHDEDDLQAYLDWLAENQDGESASTEAEPQELELSKREVVVTQPVTLPVGSHVFFYDGGFSPKTTWTNDWMFRVPVSSSMRVENFVFNYSSSDHYLSGSKPSMRRFFDIFGNIYFGPGCHLRGYYNSSYSSTDDYIPGSVIYMDPSSRVRLGGARFDNVVFRLNTVVNIYVTVRLTYNIYIYIPVGCRYNGFRLMAPEQGFQFNQSDLENIKLVDLNGWDVSIDDDGYVVLQERVYVTPDITLDESVNNSSTLSTYNGSLVNATLVRKLQPGGWNTFSVPFAIDEETLTEKFGEGTEVKQLNGSELDGTTLTLNFSDVSEIEAGVPYLVRVPDVVENPVFEGVTVYSSTSNSTSSYVDFVPVVNPVTLKGGDKSVLFVTGGNSLAYPSSTSTMKGFRAYFKLHEEMANVRAFTMSFDGFETGISDDVKCQKSNGDGAVYDLSGRRVEKPRKGMYIENGRKVIVK